MTPIFEPFPKIARISRECYVTEKIDGTNASILIMSGSADTENVIHSWYSEEDECEMILLAGSRNRWITPQNDNMGFARWVQEHAEELQQLGPGRHHGEWWGCGIQRNYGLKEKRWSLFNVGRWCQHGEEPGIIATADPRFVQRQDVAPPCCHVVPLLYRGEFCTVEVDMAIVDLEREGSQAAPGFLKAEGVIVYHVAAGISFKKTLEKDEQPKGRA